MTRARAHIAVAPAAVDFGSHVGGSTSTATLQILNSGVAALNITSIQVTSDARSAFSVGSTPTTIAPSASASLIITYVAPTTPGADSAVLAIASDADNAPEFDVTLSGVATLHCASPQIVCDTVCVNPLTDMANCGGCGTTCTNGKTCSAGVCTCPVTCMSLGKNCGSVPDTCGGTLTCGTCTSPLTCAGGGVANVCGCTAESDAVLCGNANKNCGNATLTDSCGSTRAANCGTCTSPETCAGLGVANVCGVPVFPVTVALAGNGDGAVSSSPTGINCGATCSANFNSASTVTLTPTPDGTSSFSGFTGDCTGMTCSLTNLSAARNVTATFIASPSLLVFTQQPTSTTSGTAFSPAVTVAVEDSLGRVVTSSSAMITLTPSAGALSGSNSVAAVNGIATFSNLSMAVAGSYTLTATSGALASIPSNSFTISAGLPAQLVFGQQPTSTTSSAPISPAVTVLVQDAAGNLTNSTATIALATSPSTTLAGGSANAVGGVATFNGISIAAAGSYTLTATSPPLAPATSNSFTISAGTATQLVFGQQPTSTTSSATISPAVTVKIEDAAGNVTASTSMVSLATNPSTTLAGTTSVAALGGVATFSNLSVALAGSYTLTATSAPLTTATSSPFTISAGTATQLVFGQQPTSTTSGAAISPAVTVKIEDAAGNLTPSIATVSLATSPSTTLSGTTSIAAVAGVATFNNLSIAAANTYTLSAASNPLTGATSSSFTITALTSAIGDVAVNVGNATLTKLRAADGTVAWSTARSNDGAIAVDPLDFGVYTGLGNHAFGGSAALYKYDVSGNPAWSSPFSQGNPNGCGAYYGCSGGIAVDTTSATPGVVCTETGCDGYIVKFPRAGGGMTWGVGTLDMGAPAIDSSTGTIYAIDANSYHVMDSVTAAGTRTEVAWAADNGVRPEVNPADGNLYYGQGTTLYNMSKASLGTALWGLNLSGSLAGISGIGVQPFSGGFIFVGASGAPKIVVVNPATQTVATTFATAVAPTSIAVNPNGGNVYVAGGTHFVYAYSVSGALLWTSPDLGGNISNIATVRNTLGTAPTGGVVIGTSPTSPQMIVANSTNVYFTTNTEIYSLPVTGGTPTPFAPIAGGNGDSGAYGLGLDGSFLYFTDYGPGQLDKVSLVSPYTLSVMTSFFYAAYYAQAVAVAGGNVYWGGYASGQVELTPTGGSSITQLFNAGSTYNSIRLTTDSSNVYWSSNPNPGYNPPNHGGIYQLSLSATSGAGTLPLATGLASPTSVATTSGYVYWTDGTNNNVSAVPIGGSTVSTVAPTETGASCIVADSTAIYWVDVLSTTSPGSSAIRTCTIGSGGSCGPITTLATVSDYVTSLAVNGQSLFWVGAYSFQIWQSPK